MSVGSVVLRRGGSVSGGLGGPCSFHHDVNRDACSVVLVVVVVRFRLGASLSSIAGGLGCVGWFEEKHRTLCVRFFG